MHGGRTVGWGAAPEAALCAGRTPHGLPARHPPWAGLSHGRTDARPSPRLGSRCADPTPKNAQHRAFFGVGSQPGPSPPPASPKRSPSGKTHHLRLQAKGSPARPTPKSQYMCASFRVGETRATGSEGLHLASCLRACNPQARIATLTGRAGEWGAVLARSSPGDPRRWRRGRGGGCGAARGTPLASSCGLKLRRSSRSGAASPRARSVDFARPREQSAQRRLLQAGRQGDQRVERPSFTSFDINQALQEGRKAKFGVL